MLQVGNGGAGPEQGLFSLREIEEQQQEAIADGPGANNEEDEFGLPSATEAAHGTDDFSKPFPLEGEWRLLPLERHKEWVEMYKKRKREQQPGPYWFNEEYKGLASNPYAFMLTGAIRIAAYTKDEINGDVYLVLTGPYAG